MCCSAVCVACLTILLLKGRPRHMNIWLLLQVYGAGPSVDITGLFRNMDLCILAVLKEKPQEYIHSAKSWLGPAHLGPEVFVQCTGYHATFKQNGYSF